MSLSLFPTQHEPEMGLCFQMVDEPEMSAVAGRAFQEFVLLF
jgi:hypothetical protein